jgi:hypothetical protein
VLVLAARDSGSASAGEVAELYGRTSSGFPIKLVVVDEKVNGFYTRAAVRCPWGESRDWRWFPFDGAPVPFHYDGSSFSVRERSDFSEAVPPSVVVSVMRGELEDSGSGARGTIRSRAGWGSGPDAIECSGRATFSARATD